MYGRALSWKTQTLLTDRLDRHLFSHFGQFTDRDAAVVPNKAVDVFNIRLIHKPLLWHVFTSPSSLFSNDLLHSYTWVFESVSSPSLVKISLSFTSSSVRNLAIMRCAPTEGTTCALTVITIDKMQVDTHRHVTTVIGYVSRGNRQSRHLKKSPVYT